MMLINKLQICDQSLELLVENKESSQGENRVNDVAFGPSFIKPLSPTILEYCSVYFFIKHN